LPGAFAIHDVIKLLEDGSKADKVPGRFWPTLSELAYRCQHWPTAKLLRNPTLVGSK